MTNKAAALAWTLLSGDGSRPACCDFNDQDVLQLKGIFMSLDLDKDGLLTMDQVITAFKYVGLNPRSDSVSHYFLNSSGLRVSGVSFDTFVAILSEERKSLLSAKEQLDTLFSFVDSDDTGTISVNELEQLLTSNASPFRFSKPEFGAFLLTVDCTAPNKRINIGLLKSKLLFGLL